MSGPARARLVLASGNPGKLREFGDLLAGLPCELVSQRELGIADPEETGLSFVENALLKARNASVKSGLPALADDSGLMVDALGGAPGLYSARYAGPQADSAANCRKLLGELAKLPAGTVRTARFVCVLAWLRHPADALPVIAQACWEGSILHAPQGEGGFGYDPIFLDPLRGCSAAQLDPVDKNARSHRGQAFAELRRRMQAHVPR